MAYQINFTDQVSNVPLQVEDNTINQSTSLDFPGRNITGYGKIIAENFLHLLENFASTSPPVNPVKGQLYYNTNSNQMELYDGTLWVAAGGLKKGAEFPSSSQSTAGDLFSNTNTGELYFYTGGGWILIGPETPSGSRTGVLRETIDDGDGTPQNIVSLYVEGVRVGMISQSSFVPNPAINGFPVINEGLNLNANYNNVWGTSSSSNALTVKGLIVPAENFLRGDAASVSTNELILKTDRGLTVGPEGQLKLTSDGNIAVVSQNTPNSSLDIRVNNNGVIRTVVRVDSNERVGINNLIPQESLDVVGNTLISGQLRVTSTEESLSVSSGSGVFDGGVGISGSVNIGEDLTLETGSIYTTSIVPKVPAGSTITAAGTIGTENLAFRRIFSERFDGNFYGKLTGTFEGSVVNGSAPKLSSRTKFKIAGDIVDDDGFLFDGSYQTTEENPLEKTFHTTLNSNFISTKELVTSATNNDELLLSRGTPASLRKITKKDLFASVPKMPIGSIVPYAGANAPRGWLLCDGSEVKQSEYRDLFSVISYTYGDFAILQGRDSFRLPDLRGRFPLGLMSMDGQNRVLKRGSETEIISTIQNLSTADLPQNAEAKALGGKAGFNKILIARSELPEHTHDMRGTLSNGAKGSQYYAYLPESTEGGIADQNAIAGRAPPGVDSFGKLLPSSGGIATPDTTPHSQTMMDIMNPYMALNFIIYAGTDQ